MKELLFSFQGRVTRKSYWMFALAVIGVMVVASVVDVVVTGGSPVVTALAALVVVWPSLAVQVKRWHDRDKSGWWVLIALVPVVGPVWALIENGFLAGTTGDNRFGPARA
jgi:uncharacterized membrane protein YhaH (DUF805 family)